MNPDHVPFVVADERGYYEDEGIEATVENGAAATDLFFGRFPDFRADQPELTQDVSMYRALDAFCRELGLTDDPVAAGDVVTNEFVA